MPARNDDHMNIHNLFIISILRVNINCKPILSIIVVLKYITKYASKVETKSKPYYAMLLRISSNYDADRPVAVALHRMLIDNLINRDMSA